MIANVKKVVDFIRTDPLTSACAIALALSSLIVGQPGLVAFAGPASALIIVQIAEFIQKASVVIGLLFSAQTKPDDLQKKDVIPEVLTKNQPEGKEELQNPVQIVKTHRHD